MEGLYFLLQCFGERFVDCDNEQAKVDAEVNRETLVGAYNAILDYARLLIANP